jgi:5-methylcytosine-specific restriction enzyme A
MSMATGRAFRTPASYASEHTSRDAVVPFLRSRAYDVLQDERRSLGEGDSQVITAVSPAGEPIRMRVRLGWRRDDSRPVRTKKFAAAQLRARLIDKDWIKTLHHLMERDAHERITHTLLFQREGNEVLYAALIPSTKLLEVWTAQRDISAQLIATGRMGRIKKNHAMNGQSPTLWMQDDRTAESRAVADELWLRVPDLAKLPLVVAPFDDTYDDCPGLDYAQLGSDGAPRTLALRSGYKRDNAVRAAVLDRALGACERASCGEKRPYRGFLDVHHILGAEKSDRLWTCVALCPNCHREAHTSPDANKMNDALLAFAQQFSPREKGDAA